MKFLIFGGNHAVFKGFDGNSGVKNLLSLPRTLDPYTYAQLLKRLIVLGLFRGADHDCAKVPVFGCTPKFSIKQKNSAAPGCFSRNGTY